MDEGRVTGNKKINKDGLKSGDFEMMSQSSYTGMLGRL